MDETPVTAPHEDEIIAHAGRYYRNARYVICGMVVAAGLWFGYDGWINWPKQVDEFNHKSEEQKAAGQMPHSDLDILIQRCLNLTLCPLAPILLGFFLYRSRGVYRLSGTTLHVPGHPPIPFEAVTEIDDSKWKRKGIARVSYRLDGASDAATLTLDDFIYEQGPTDKIFERLEKWLNPEGHQAVVDGDNNADENPEPRDVNIS